MRPTRSCECISQLLGRNDHCDAETAAREEEEGGHAEERVRRYAAGSFDVGSP
jgi:hypothetical protein